MLFRTLSAIFLLIVLAPALAAADESKPKLTPPPAQVLITVDPPVAPPGVKRRIIVAGTWPNGCIPTQASLAYNNPFGRPQIGIVLAEPLTFTVCFSALRSYQYELEYTPESAGQLEMVAMSNITGASARTTLVTSSTEQPFSRWDVSGAFYDPATAGSGVMLAHEYGGSDKVFGSWHTYDPATGTSRWYSLQQGFWSADGTQWTSTLFETEADPVPPCSVACSLPAARARFLGVMRLTFSRNGANGGVDAAFDLVLGDGSTVRKGQLTRLLPYRLALP